MIEQFTKLDVYFSLAINGMFTGIGVAVGTWIAQKHILERLEKKIDKINRDIKQ